MLYRSIATIALKVLAALALLMSPSLESVVSYRSCVTVVLWIVAVVTFVMYPALAVAQTSGLVAAYAFNESSGTTTADASGNGNNGVLTNGPLFVAGKNSNGVRLDGVNDYVNLSNPPSLRLTGSMTLSAWINSSAFPADDAAIISKRQSSNTGYQLDTTIDQGSRTIGFKITDGSGNNVARYGATAMVVNTWYHVAGVYNATNRTMTVYLNGQLDNGALVGTVPATQRNSNQNVNIGRRPGVPGTFNFAGVLDDVRIYNRALSQAEIQTDMNTPVGSTPAPNTAPTISSITNQTITEDTATGAIPFTVGDAETPGSLTVSGSSTNTALVPNANIVFGGSGANRTVTITPAANQSGSAQITLTVSDGALSTPTSFQFTVTQTSGLAAGWNFNEGTGSIAHDISGNNNTASLTSASAWSAGEYGGGISFASANFLTVPNSPSLDIAGNALTLSLWLNPQPLAGGDRAVIGKFWNTTMTSPFYQYGLELDGGSTPHFYVGTAGGLVGAAMGSALPFGQWNHLAVVFNGSQVQFYLNSELVSTQPLSASITARGNQMRIGADANGTQIFNGTMDDVRVYARVLTQLDIQVDMDTPLGGPSGSDTTPPTVSITFPANNAQVNDIITVTADAADNIGVAGVQFLVDSTNVGAEDGTPPYGLSWDTRTATNGAHTLMARARDTSGNVTFSTPIIVNVANTNFFQNEILATGFTLPTSIKFLPDGRMLVVELPGTIKVLPPPYTQPAPTPFLTLNLNITGYAGLQQGIFDIALDPNFATNHYYYIFYTNDSPNRDRLSRFTANATLDGTIPGSEVILYQDPQDANTEHHGGAVNFGNDGKIYFTTGEHFTAGNAQLLSNPRGKIHRINPDGTIPTDNPFYDGAGPNWDSIWALGLRNPYRAYYDAPTGRLFVGDVGGNDNAVAKEEVNVGVAGANYGWPNSEGPCAAPCTSPIYSYPHNGRDAAVTGGFVYHGTQFPSAYQGSYFFADYTQNWIRRLTFAANGNVNGVFNFEPADGSADGPYGDIVYLTEGPDGALYYVDLGYSDVGGTFGISKIRRIRYMQTNQAPVAVASATPTKGPGPLTVTFSSNGSLDPEGQPLSYAWTFGDNTTSTDANPTHTYTQNGQYTARLSVSDGVNTTLATPLFIRVGNPPSVTISSPQNGTLFRAGDIIAFSGDATDSEDGTLPVSAFTWTIDFLHAGHVHPGASQTGIKNGTFAIPTTGHDFSGDTRYRIMLTVTDSDGLPTSQSVLIYPDKVNLTFGTAPTGLTLHLDGIARTVPFVHDTLIGFTHTIAAQDQIQATTSYTFASWSDGGAQQHVIVVPSAAQSYTATYIATPILLPQGLVAAWNFSEGAGTSASDGSGNGNTATLINGPAWTAGQYDTGLSFNGINNYLTVPNSSSLDISGNTLTLTMWINPQSLGGRDSVVLGKFWNTTMTSPYYQYGLELSGGSEPFFYVGTNTGVLVAQMGSSLSFGQWSHLAVVFNGAQAQFYVNGLLVRTQPLAASIQARGNLLNIGADIRPSQFHKGLLDEMRIYNRALTSSEVQTDMTTALPSRF